jgi:xanthine dehydrogenase molybdopterin-binding subunit B
MFQTIHGVVAFYSAKDIPGSNTFMPENFLFVAEAEEIFCRSQVKFFSQPVGILLAYTLELAYRAAELVEVVYENKSKVEEVIISYFMTIFTAIFRGNFQSCLDPQRSD